MTNPSDWALKAAEEIRKKRPNDPTYFYLHNLDAEIISRHAQAEREEVRGILEISKETIELYGKQLDALLNHCGKEGGECSECAMIICPFEEPLHFHHDGCPSCCCAPRDNPILKKREELDNAPTLINTQLERMKK